MVGAIFVAGALVINLALVGLPVFTGIALVGYRLYEMDILINRTLVYGTLMARWRWSVLEAWPRYRRSFATSLANSSNANSPAWSLSS